MQIHDLTTVFILQGVALAIAVISIILPLLLSDRTKDRPWLLFALWLLLASMTSLLCVASLSLSVSSGPYPELFGLLLVTAILIFGGFLSIKNMAFYQKREV